MVLFMLGHEEYKNKLQTLINRVNDYIENPYLEKISDNI